MTRFAIAAFLIATLGATLHARGEVIVLKGGGTVEAYSIEAENISGIYWEQERRKAGIKKQLWEVEHVRYPVAELDDYNSLPRKAASGRGDTLQDSAEAFLSKEMEQPTGIGKDEWERIRLTCRYYLAMAYMLREEYAEAAVKYQEFLEAADEYAGAIRDGDNFFSGVRFKSPFSGSDVKNAGALHRLYLDGLNDLGDCHANLGNAADASKYGYQPLLALTEQLYQNSDRNEYFDWAIRALRSAARLSEKNAESAEAGDDKAAAKEAYKAARESYEQLANVARRKGGSDSKDANEAQLKVGFLLIKEGDLRAATAQFHDGVKKWEAVYRGRASAPASGWISRDVAYLTAGSYIGSGLIAVEEAKVRNAADKWSEALKNFSAALAIFRGDDELRSMALLHSAQASSELAKLNGRKKEVAGNHARRAEKYVTELKELLPKSKAAESPLIDEINKVVKQYRVDE